MRGQLRGIFSDPKMATSLVLWKKSPNYNIPFKSYFGHSVPAKLKNRLFHLCLNELLVVIMDAAMKGWRCKFI